ncbi:non-ribosomal peptide synthetase [Klebsiella pneumoniae]|uniref:Non-ribosomal peptide synthetase n=1 Tax=Klebsiella pneumoniae TaxID=573 RepID=A0A377VYV5_KLEPN|nr:non-ribosomal peptide synthetase [Klebsiella pneumoniae]
MMSGNPLSWPQEQCHIIDQLYPYSAVNIIGGVVTIEGNCRSAPRPTRGHPSPPFGNLMRCVCGL